MNNCKLLALLLVLTTVSSSCGTSKEAVDQGIVKNGVEQQNEIRELAEFSVAYTIGKTKKSFRTDTISNKTIKKRFNHCGYGGLVTVTYNHTDNNKISGLIDSTVIFKQATLKGIIEIIYDFSNRERIFDEDKTNPEQYVFLIIANRIYYRRRPIPMM